MPNENVLLIHKPPGPTSHDIVDSVRKITGERRASASPKRATATRRRVGHTGTLDPFAEGLLIVLVGREATKRQSEFMKLDKEYIATLHLGAETDTQDLTGKPVKSKFPISLPKGDNFQFPNKSQIPNIKIIKTILKNFEGQIEQIPPDYSAIKIKGKKAYELARKGEKIDLKPRKIKIRDIKILNYKWPLLVLKIKCSSGTYIRSLARDIGRELKTGAYLEKLVRTKIGNRSIDDALSLEDLAKIHKRW